MLLLSLLLPLPAIIMTSCHMPWLLVLQQGRQQQQAEAGRDEAVAEAVVRQSEAAVAEKAAEKEDSKTSFRITKVLSEPKLFSALKT